MRYDLGSYLARKRIPLADFAAKNNIRSVNDIGMFALNNKEFDLSDEVVDQLVALFPPEATISPEEILIISPSLEHLEGADENGKVVEEEPVTKKTSTKKSSTKRQTAS